MMTGRPEKQMTVSLQISPVLLDPKRKGVSVTENHTEAASEEAVPAAAVEAGQDDAAIVAKYAHALMGLYDRMLPSRVKANAPYRKRGIIASRLRVSQGLLMEVYRLTGKYGADYPGDPRQLVWQIGCLFLAVPALEPDVTRYYMSSLDLEPFPVDKNDPTLSKLYGRDGPFGLYAVRAVTDLELPRLPYPVLENQVQRR
jgi:hypothetical protein